MKTDAKGERLPIARPCMGEAEWQALREPIEKGWLTQGPKVAEFERRFAARHGAAHGVAASSCTTALHLALAALGVGPGDEVIVPAFTWVATANVVLYCGATPVLADVDPATFNVDPGAVAALTGPKTRAVMPVHLFGLCADVDALTAAAPGVPLVCDAACAAGAAYKGVPAGSLGLAAAFSFHPRKPLTTGEGGMATTSDAGLAETMVKLRNHGAEISEEQRHAGPQPYLLPDFNLLGFNYRMTDMQGAVGLVQLDRFDDFLTERRALAASYARELAGIDWIAPPAEPEGYDHGWQAYVCMIDEGRAPMTRNEIMAGLQDMGIDTRPGTHALHTIGHLRERFGYAEDDFPGALACERLSVALPFYNGMPADGPARVARALRRLAGEA